MNPKVEKPRILVADDEPLILEMITNKLEESYEVVGVDNGTKARNLLDENEPFQLLLLDLFMPGLNGIEVLDHLETQSTTKPEVLFMTAFVGRLEDRGVPKQNIIIKPFTMDELDERVAQLLGLQKSTSSGFQQS